MEKLKKTISSKMFLETIIYIAFSLIMIALYYFDLNYKIIGDSSEKKIKIVFLAVSLIGCALIYLIIRLLKYKANKKEHIIFLIVAIPLCLAYLILSPLYTGSDEQIHFYRAYEISDMKFITPVTENGTGSVLPKSLKESFVKQNDKIKYSDIKQMASIDLNKENTEFYRDIYPSASLYIPIQYLPHVIGISIGKIFDLGPFYLGMLARLCNMIFYITICCIGIKLLPRHKLYAMAILLTPAILSTATTLSTDAITNSTIFLFIAYILNIIYTRKVVKAKDMVILSVLCILISVFKLVYLPIIFLLLILSKENFKSRKTKYIFCIITIIVSIIISFSWLNSTSKYFDSYYTNTDAQKEYIFSNIIEYIFIIFRTYVEFFTYLITNSFAGVEMYNTQLQMYSIIPIIFIILAIIAVFNEEKENNFKLWQKIFIILLFLGIIALISTALYIQCTAQFVAIGNKTIAGLQGRYFIPIILGLILILGKKTKKILENKQLMSYIMMAHIPVYFTMLVRFIR